MIHRTTFASIFLFLFSISGNAECIVADLVLVNGTVYTGNLNQPLAQTIAIKDEFIEYVGNDPFSDSAFCGNPKIIDLTGQYIFPGFMNLLSMLEMILFPIQHSAAIQKSLI